MFSVLIHIFPIFFTLQKDYTQKYRPLTTMSSQSSQSSQSFKIIDALSVGELMDYEDYLDLSPDFFLTLHLNPLILRFQDQLLNSYQLKLLLLHIGAQKRLS